VSLLETAMIRTVRVWFLEQLAMYSAYHRDRRNQMTRHVGVPLIVFSLLLALSQVPLGEVGGVPVAANAVVLGLLLLLYIVTVPLTGFLTAVFYIVLLILAQKLAAHPAVGWFAGAAFIGGWIIQFIGHVFEGRRPALVDNALQIFMAPPFLIAEVLFALGLEKTLAVDLDQRAVKYLATAPPAHR